MTLFTYYFSSITTFLLLTTFTTFTLSTVFTLTYYFPVNAHLLPLPLYNPIPVK